MHIAPQTPHDSAPWHWRLDIGHTPLRGIPEKCAASHSHPICRQREITIMKVEQRQGEQRTSRCFRAGKSEQVFSMRLFDSSSRLDILIVPVSMPLNSDVLIVDYL